MDKLILGQAVRTQLFDVAGGTCFPGTLSRPAAKTSSWESKTYTLGRTMLSLTTLDE